MSETRHRVERTEMAKTAFLMVILLQNRVTEPFYTDGRGFISGNFGLVKRFLEGLGCQIAPKKGLEDLFESSNPLVLFGSGGWI